MKKNITLEELLDLLPQRVLFYPDALQIPMPSGKSIHCGYGLLHISKPNGWVITYRRYEVAEHFIHEVFMEASVSKSKTLKQAVLKTLRYLKKKKLI